MVKSIQKQKERIRGPAIEVFRKYKEGVSFPDALKLAKEAKRVIASNKRLDKALVGSDEWGGIDLAFPCYTGTMTGYEEKNKKLGKEIVYTDSKTKQRYIFPTGDAKGSKNVILVVEHPDYELKKDGKDLRVCASSFDILENFPVSDGWYKTDEKHGIPLGKKVNRGNEDARSLWRIKGARVGPVARDGFDFWQGDGRRDVYLNAKPFVELRVAVEALELKLKITQGQGKLIIRGTPEQLAEIKKLIKENQK
ncbi:hypothetical protein KAW38_00580 [Candidatus Micrarchaeota archaeon]|nr:hypothetical protein [Candidatus Micrarchaeota archaeon]